MLSGGTFERLKKKLVILAIHRVFVTQRELLFEGAKERGKIDLLGDGRCDSPGYNAKYGTYIVINKQTGMIINNILNIFFCLFLILMAKSYTKL